MIQTSQLYQYFLEHPKVETDSRKAGPGQLFFALKGANFDGNKFAAQAVAAGAAFAIIDDPQYAQGEQFLLVEDVLKSLQDLARFHRRQFTIPVLAITGSNGKTTTKELISVVMGSHYPAHFTKGNFNNHIGVPLTLLEMATDTEVAIIEMGANHVGEIADLCQIAEPTHGLITNIGKAHLEGFGGLEGVKKGKSELYDFLSAKSGVAFVNSSESYLTDLSQSVNKKIRYQKSENPRPDIAPYEMKVISTDPFVKVAFLSSKGNLQEINTQLLGAYNVNNVMSAVAVGRYFKVPDEKMITAIESYCPDNNRSQIFRKGSNTFILDAYNANPTSMEKALESFALRSGDHKMAVLGDMLELGIYTEEEHRRILKKALDLLGNKNVVVVGKHFAKPAEDNKLSFFSNVKELRVWFLAAHFENTLFLLKGSRGIQLEKLLEPLETR